MQDKDKPYKIFTRGLVIMFGLSIAAYFLGGWLMMLYGLDPPYIYMKVGFVLQVVSFLLALIFMGILVFRLVKVVNTRRHRARSESF